MSRSLRASLVALAAIVAFGLVAVLLPQFPVYEYRVRCTQADAAINPAAFGLDTGWVAYADIPRTGGIVIEQPLGQRVLYTPAPMSACTVDTRRIR
ncbi:MAG: hypothetical protein LW860_16365 [Xanthomonadaceae bacterium]|jgi:hypothetical protein|nr:hypothetical protein [Xanthomonadaceae bacterium]